MDSAVRDDPTISPPTSRKGPPSTLAGRITAQARVMITYFRRDPSEGSCSPLRFRVFIGFGMPMQGCAVRWPGIGPEISPELVGVLGLLGF